MIKKVFNAIVFFIGWILSPLTWWNDAFVNMPISYLLANALYCITKLPFTPLIVGSYWFTNILGFVLMYFGGKKLIVKSRDRLKATVIIIAMVTVYSAVMIYLDHEGKLAPLETYFKRFCVQVKNNR